MIKKSLAALAALSLAVSPALAQGAPQPAVEQVEGSEIRGGFIIPALAGIAALLLILSLTDTWPFDDEDPVSP